MYFHKHFSLQRALGRGAIAGSTALPIPDVADGQNPAQISKSVWVCVDKGGNGSSLQAYWNLGGVGVADHLFFTPCPDYLQRKLKRDFFSPPPYL